jgi:hypothetical protein
MHHFLAGACLIIDLAGVLFLLDRWTGFGEQS